MPSQNNPKVAVIGSGIAGLSAAWALHKSKAFEVHIYEGSPFLGGHAHTVSLRTATAERVNVDTGFMVLNTSTYPTLLSLLSHLSIPTTPATLSFTLWPPHYNPHDWRLHLDILRFRTFAADLLSGPTQDGEVTLDAYLTAHRYSPAFRTHILRFTAPLAHPDPLNQPAVALVRWLHNHQLLYTPRAEAAAWLSIPGGARAYVDALVAGIPEYQIHLSTPVARVGTREDGRGVVSVGDGLNVVYDHVILATHGDAALRLLGREAGVLEREVLGSFSTALTEVVVHCEKGWEGRSYDVNTLQRLRVEDVGVLAATVAAKEEPDSVLGRWRFRLPVLTVEAVRAQKRLSEIQGRRGISFVGAWTGGGFHEDGCVSGLLAAARLGAGMPVAVKRRRREGLGSFRDVMWRMLVWALWVMASWIFGDGQGQGKKGV